jgi:hypothetical protein
MGTRKRRTSCGQPQATAIFSGPQPRRLIVGHIHDGEAPEVLLGLDERTVGEQRPDSTPRQDVSASVTAHLVVPGIT